MLSGNNFDLEINYVLSKIKNCETLSINKSIIEYVIDLVPLNHRILTQQVECEILKILDEYKIIEILNREISLELKIKFHLKIIQPKFNSIFQTYNEINSEKSLSKNIVNKLTLNDKTNKYSLPKYYIIHEINSIKMILKYLLSSGILIHKNYKYINSILNSLNTFIIETLEIKYTEDSLENLNNDNKQNKSDKFTNNNVIQKSLFDNKPLPITGEIKVIGLDEGLKALSKKDIDMSKPRFPFKIPAGTQWHNVIIKFINNEKIEIHVKKLKHITDFKEMGMMGKGKIPKPNEQWYFLKVLSQCYGEISIRDPEAKDKYKKHKQELTETLRSYFSIDYDPFYPYHSSPEKRGNSYKIKLTLIPPPQSHHKTEPTIDEDPLGIHEYLRDNYYKT